MANLPENPTWEPGIRQLELTDPVQGGPDGTDNIAPKQLANRTAWLKQEVELRAPLNSPALIGNPTAPTQAPGTNNLSLANTAFVQAALAALVDSSPAALDTLNELAAALGDDPDFSTTVMNTLAGKADILRGVPTGVVLPFTGSTAPAGWLKWNGAMLSRESYPELWAHANSSGMLVTEAAWQAGDYGKYSSGDGATTFRLGDGRAEFIRGLDDGRGIDTGRALGSLQADEIRSHRHPMSTGAPSGSVETGGGSNAVGGNHYTGYTGGVETRPRNEAYLFIVKY